ncbi:MAG: GNAT family N-acetyltransferase [Oscillospiraceae bacterium]|nr:GNAT family N-acetyltransferase [Oscillospiraceae bacterium]
MLLIIKKMKELDFGQLMAVYEEGNRENGREFWPDLPEGQQLLRTELDFYQYLRESFFQTEGAFYAVWTENGKYVSALRLEPYQDGLLLEALETARAHRRKGYAMSLIRAVQEQLEDMRIYAHVHKKNTASLSTHERCGFRRILEHAVYIDGSVRTNTCTYCYEKTAR